MTRVLMVFVFPVFAMQSLLSDEKLYEIAEACKEETYRQSIEDDLLNQIVSCLEDCSINFDRKRAELCCRIIGNMCYDCDANRDKILNCPDSIKRLIKLFDHDINNLVYGASLNLTMDNELVQNEFISNGIFQYIQRDISEKSVQVLALKVLANLVESDQGYDIFFDSQIPRLLGELLVDVRSNDDIEIIDSISIVLESVVEHLKGQERVAQCNLFTAILEFLSAKHPTSNWSVEDQNNFTEIKILILKQLSILTMNGILHLIIRYRHAIVPKQ
jgi:hypothetical protein